MEFSVYDPYCGPAPVPAELIGRWNFDPFLLAVLALGALLWMAYGRRDQTGKIAFSGSYILIFIAFISPLCALSSALFSARVAHHLILIGGIAPLLAIALPWRRGPILPLSALTILHAAFVWIWHAPDPYAMALDSHAIYWLMQLTLGGSAYLLWREVFSPFTRKGNSVMALLATIMQMGFLGALLVFAPQAVFAPHFTTTVAFGLAALEDQQLAGLLMWVPAVLPYIGVGLYLLAAMIKAEEARSPA